jgi:signal transduction histidine kinase
VDRLPRAGEPAAATLCDDRAVTVSRLLVAPLRAGATYRRTVHLLLGAVLLLPYLALVWVLSLSLAGGLDPIGFVVLLVPAVAIGGAVALVPGVRALEVAAARVLLDVDLPAPVGEGWSGRRRAAAWLLLNMLVGGVAALAILAALPYAAGMLVAPFSPLPPLPTGVRALWTPVVGLVILAALGHVLALAGRWLAHLAPAVLGPTPEERLRAELAASRQEAARLAERTRIARELHDSVGHALTVTTLQAGAAAQVLDSDPEFARRALDAIAETGRTALEELDQVLGVLREELAPPLPPDLTALRDLVEGARAAGITVDLTVPDDLAGLPQAVSREAYRIVQESVTNTLRHAGRVPVRVALEVDDDLRIRVENPLGRRGRPGGGRGLRGMAERAADLGGSADAGEQDGRWVVEATLPLGEPRTPHGRRAVREAGR